MKRVEKEQIILLQKMLIEHFGGLHGIRDEKLLDSAINAPFQTFGGEELYPGLIAKASALCYGLICNHAFQDGNKRIGILAILTFLDINNLEMKATDEELIELGLRIASGEMVLEQVEEWVLRHIS